jgi:dethiobiotin synthetase
MKVFITGTDTNVGKTVISAWLCYHLNYAYWKSIQTGSIDGTDRDFIQRMDMDVQIFRETYVFKEPCSPHVAASLSNIHIDIAKIISPNTNNLIIEGAGGVLVPVNQNDFVIDLIKNLNTPVILIARASLGTINHTLLSIEALRNRQIPILGVIVNNYIEQEMALKNKEAIESYGNIPVWYGLPSISPLTSNDIKKKNYLIL